MHIPCGLAGSCRIRTEHPLANPTSLDFPEILSRMLVGLTLTSSSSLTPYIKHFIIRKLYPTMFKSNLPAFLGYHPWEIITLNASPARTAAPLQQLNSGFVVVSELNNCALETLMSICIGTYLGYCMWLTCTRIPSGGAGGSIRNQSGLQSYVCNTVAAELIYRRKEQTQLSC